jgi:hypothetical protein
MNQKRIALMILATGYGAVLRGWGINCVTCLKSGMSLGAEIAMALAGLPAGVVVSVRRRPLLR